MANRLANIYSLFSTHDRRTESYVCFRTITLSAIAILIATFAFAAPACAQAKLQKCKISGKIITADKAPPKSKGWLYYHSKSSTGVVDQFTDSFSFETNPGEIWLTYFSEGYAPAWTEKMVLAPGQVREDIILTLHEGNSHRLKITDANGNPVANATVVPLVTIHKDANGPIYPQLTDEKGEVVLKHLAAAPYSFRVNASGYEPLRTSPSALPESLQHSLTRCKPTTGKILLSDGSPAANAKLRLLVEMTDRQGFDSPGNEKDDFWGKIVATTNEQGSLTLDQLTQTSSYLFLAEATDGSRVLLHTLRAGQSDVAIHIPARLDLRLKIEGDLKSLPERGGKPFLSIRQSVDFKPIQQSSFGALIGADCYVETTPEGNFATLQGLAIDTNPLQAKQQIKIGLGKTTKTIDLNTTGLTEDVITLDATP